ncbi:MAG: competence protein ComEC, partial [Candidatus Berkelbacteria bacterium Licking1014_85]
MNFNTKIHISQLFSAYIIVFFIGILLSQYIPYDSEIYLQAFVLFICVSLIFSPDFWIREAGRASAIFVLGLAFSNIFNTPIFAIDQNVIFDNLIKLRENFNAVLANLIPLPYSNLATGLVVGIDQNFPKDLKNAFINSGTIHIVAISGYNVAIIIKIFADSLKQFGRIWSFWVGTILIIAFTILVGGQASVVRAAIMGWLFLLARFIYRLPYIFSALLFSALLMTIYDREILTEISFLLTFSAMIGMIYISPTLQDFLNNYLKKIPSFLRSILAETLGAQIAVIPIIAYFFGRISIISPVSNILILPLIPLAMLLSFLGYLTGLWSIALGKIVALPLYLIVKYVIFIAEKTANLPFSNLSTSN